MAFGLWRHYPEWTAIPEYLKINGCLQENIESFEDACKVLNEDYGPYNSLLPYLQTEINLKELNIWFGQIAPVWIKAHRSRLVELKKYFAINGIEARNTGLAFELAANSPLNEAENKGFCRIQDLSSQLSIDAELHPSPELIWDACCGAGGKSLLLCEAFPDATLYISDSRSAMVNNAEQRFRLAGYNAPVSAVCDLKNRVEEMVFTNGVTLKKAVFDMVVCDVPCSGSGTWRRTPENLLGFDEKQIEYYAGLQRKIVENALPFLKSGGTLVYITCSVFADENELNAKRIAAENGLVLKESRMLGGLKLNADYLYRAVLGKP